MVPLTLFEWTVSWGGAFEGSDAGADPGKKRDPCQTTRKKKSFAMKSNGY
jgi:hypothetical protein